MLKYSKKNSFYIGNTNEKNTGKNQIQIQEMLQIRSVHKALSDISLPNRVDFSFCD